MIKKYINNPDDVVEEMLEGFIKANDKKVKKTSERVLARKDAPVKDKVGIVSGGGSGHKPAFIGYLGEGLLDSVAVGDIFASPGVDAILKAIKAADSGKGVLCCIGNYSGDTMNFDMAKEMAEAEGIDVEIVIINDDVASAPKNDIEDRRGVAGEIIVWKVAGAMAEKGLDLKSIKSKTEEILFNTRSMGVAHEPCVLPNTGEESFEIGEEEMEIGVGHHGEPGIERTKMKQADEVTKIMTEEILKDLPFTEGDEVVALINGLGSTSLLEMYICNRKMRDILESKGIKVYKTYTGEYFTSQEMAGFSITLTKADADTKEFMDYPCDGVHFIQR